MPFAGFNDFKHCVEVKMFRGKTKDQAKKICGTLQAKSEAEIKGKGINKKPKPRKMKPNAQTESDSIMKTFHRIEGTALVPGVSRNGNVYLEEHLVNNSNKEVKIFVGDEHEPSSKNVVGTAQMFMNHGKLMFDGRIRNTHDHPDVVEKARDGLLDISIGAIGLGEAKETEQGLVFPNIDIRHLALVGTPGVDAATVDLVMAESWILSEEQTVEESVKNEKERPKAVLESTLDKKQSEVDNMSEELLKENKKLKEQIESMQKQTRKDLIESIMKVNSKLRESELLERTESELKIIDSYEKVIKETEEKKKNEEAKDEEKELEKKDEESKEEGSGVVEPEKKDGAGDDVKESFKEMGGLMTLSESAYEKFNEEMRTKYQ